MFLEIHIEINGFWESPDVIWGCGVIWCLIPLSSIFQLYCGSQFYWWRKPEYPEKITDLSQVAGKLYRINVVSSTPRHERVSNFIGDRH
jgi:hypothetical protein